MNCREAVRKTRRPFAWCIEGKPSGHWQVTQDELVSQYWSVSKNLLQYDIDVGLITQIVAEGFLAHYFAPFSARSLT
jgi:hypothetical protein